MSLICKCCSVVAFKHTEHVHPLTTLDSTALPYCVPQLFDLEKLQDDLIKVYVAGKHLLQKPEGIHMSFHFKEQNIAQPIPGNL